MAELKIKIPERWMNFIDECYEVTGRNRDKMLRGWMRAAIEAEIEDRTQLSLKERIRLVDKHKLTDIHQIVQWERDEAAGILRKPEPTPLRKMIRDMVTAQIVKEVCKLVDKGHTPDELDDSKIQEKIAEIPAGTIEPSVHKDLVDSGAEAAAFTPEDIVRIRAMTRGELEERMKTYIANSCVPKKTVSTGA